jgi:hypothetical protein
VARGGRVERAGFASAQCQHHTASSGALALSKCVLRASTCCLFGRRSTRAAPYTGGQTYVHHTTVELMLTHLPQFCNAFFFQVLPTWQRAWATWCTRSPARLARIRRLLQAACRTPRCLPTPLLYVTRTHPPTQHSAACTWWTPRSISLLDDQTCTRRYQPHVLAKAAVCLSAPDRFAVIVLEHKRVVHFMLCTYWREPRVPTGESPVYLLEKKYDLTFCS